MEQQPLFILKPKLSVAIIPTIILGIIALVTGISVFFRLMNLKARRYLFDEHKAEFYE